MIFPKPVGKFSDSGCKLYCGRLAPVGEESCAAHGVVELVILEAQHDAVLRVGGYPAVLHFSGWLDDVLLFVMVCFWFLDCPILSNSLYWAVGL